MAEFKDSVIFEVSIEDSKALQASAKLEKQLISLKNERKALNKEIKDGNGATDEQAKELAKLNIQIGETSKELRRTRNETKQVAGSFGEMKTQLSRAKAELNKFKPGEAGFDEAKEKVRALNEEVSEIEQSFGVFSRGVGRYKDGIISAFNEVGISLGGISGNAAALASGPLALVSIFAGATVAAGKYLSNLEEVRKETALLTGATGDLLDQLTGQAQALNDVFGTEISESVQAAQALTNAFGGNLSQNLDLLGQGLALGGNAVDDFTGKVDEFSGIAADAGLDAQQFFAVLDQGSSQGAFFLDRLPDLIKTSGENLRQLNDDQVETLNRLGVDATQLQDDIRSGAVTTFEAAQKVGTAIGGVRDNAELTGKALEILGSEAEDIGVNGVAAFAQFDRSLENVIASSNEYEQAQLRLIEAQEELRTITAAAFGEAGGFFGRIKTELQIIGSRLIVGVIKGFISFSNAVIDVYNNSILVRGVAGSIGLAFNNAFEVARLGASQLIDSLATGGKVIGAILTGDFKRVGAIYSDFLNETKENFTTFGKNTAENYVDAFESTLKGRIEKISLDFTPSASSPSASSTTQSGSSSSEGSSESGLPRLFRINVEKFQEESDAANEIADQNLERLKERIQEAIDAKEKEKEVFATAEEAKQEAQDATIDAIRAGSALLLKSKKEESKAYKIGFVAQKGASLAESLLNFSSAKADILKTATKIEATLGLAGIPIAAIYRIASFAGLAAQKASIVQDIASVKFASGGPINGGLTQGPSHTQGGMPGFVKSTGQAIEFEGNEYIFSQKAVNRIGLPTLNAMNFGNHVPRFMAGGSVAGNVVPSGIARDNAGAMKAAFRSAIQDLTVVTKVRDVIGEIDNINEIENQAKI